jgi:hypothetical protein
MTAVFVILRAFQHSSPHWIQVDVSHQLPEIAIRLAENRFITTLKEMADLLVLPIVELAVGG